MRQTATEWQKQLAPWLWTAMTLCLITGFLEFAPGGGEYYLNFVFRWKLWATLAGIILAVIVYRGVPQWDRLPAMPVSAKALAALCLLVWIGTILLGVEVANYVNF